MEAWQLEARESIRDLVARYNANGDSGRIEHVLELFSENATMIVRGNERRGRAEIGDVFAETAAGVDWGDHPVYVRHMTATLQIDLVDKARARSRCYYAVITAIGLDHWGRYIDEYSVADGGWKFSRREVTLDGSSPNSLFAPLWSPEP
jgi:3-phenylpropionate/cinnamic acid dioxygenase small subunit